MCMFIFAEYLNKPFNNLMTLPRRVLPVGFNTWQAPLPPSQLSANTPRTLNKLKIDSVDVR